MIPDEWFDPEMEVDVWVRYRHPGCSEGKDKALGIARTTQGWVWKCHRCGESGGKNIKNLSPKDALRWIKSLKEKPIARVREVYLPEDFTTKIPTKGIAWLYEKGIMDEDIELYHFGYSRYYGRLIMPVYDKGNLIYWQGRLLKEPDRDHPKYMSVFSDRKDVYFKVFGTWSDNVVLVEDILSAVKVGKISDCYALLSTNVDDALIFQLAKEYTKVQIWLDSNMAAKVTKYVSRYRSFGLKVEAIHTQEDPKFYALKKIKEILHDSE